MLDTDVRYLRGVGPARKDQLARLGIETIGDLLLHAPRGYHDRRVITPVRELVPGSEANVEGVIVSSGILGSPRSGRRFQAVLDDGTGRLKLTFFNYRYIADRLAGDVRVIASGRVELFGGLSMVHPELLFPGGEMKEEELVLPVYPLTRGISQLIMRKLVRRALEDHLHDVPRVLPPEELRSMGWTDRGEVIRTLHFPSDPALGEKARRALALEEFFVHQSLLHHVRSRAGRRKGISMPSSRDTLEALLKGLPYSLTSAQEKAVETIGRDMSGNSPMRRLLQGDVGSGKTVVAAAACAICSGAGWQSVVVAPTEVLASQHYRNLHRMLGPAGLTCGLLTGGTSASARKELHETLRDGSLDLLVGTHAVLEDTVRVPRMGLCIVDEQHKFGVAQRDRLISGSEPGPHFMLMTATPIPRTLAMSLYGDLDLSVLDEMPPGRGRTVTRVVDRDHRQRVYSFLLERLSRGERAYVVYPLREASEELDLRDASSAFRILQRGPAGEFGVGLLTGAMSSEEKLEVTGRFVEGEISVLVSTTVVEVGLDVPEATVMIISHADRFGLSQLHQLRGRIGRGGADSWCFLMKDSRCGREGMRRLSIMESTDDGFRIAEEDLMLRGPGEVAGTRQHGLPGFRIASLTGDLDLLERASSLAAGSGNWEMVSEEYRRRFGAPDVPEV
ncbi:MAG: ATP-dependent DNA helicase RecG [Candidatus Aegiribacteria sp.]